MKIAVLGSQGMAGSIIFRYLKERYSITGFSRQDYDVLKDRLPNLSEYDWVINCIGLIKQKEGSQEDFFKINTKFPHRLSHQCQKLIHLSSDCVFSGHLPKELSYSVNDNKDAQDVYGKSKAFGEPSHAIVLRTSIIGPSKTKHGLFEWFKHNHQIINGFTNHWWSGITTLELAKIIDQICQQQYDNNVYQISSNKVCKFALLNSINQIYHFEKIIQPYQDLHTINRSLHGNIIAPEITIQLKELQRWMEQHEIS